VSKFLFGIVGIIVLLVAAIIVGPGFVDWNNYKVDLTQQAERYTGRKLTIDGNIEITILPAPALVANDVRLSNVDGASSQDMVSLRSLQVRVALGPLLSGQIKVQTVQLIDPVIELERFADGRTNIEMAIADLVADDEANNSAPATTSTPSAGSTGEDDGASFSLENFVVENGTVNYRDAIAGSVEKIEMMNATFAAASLEGPFESSGSLVARNLPLEYDVSIGRIIEQRTAPVSLTIGLQPGGTKTTFSGAVIGMDETPTFKGLVKATGNNLAALIQSIGSRAGLPGMLGQPFGVEGEIEASATLIDVANLKLNLGNAVAKGAGVLELADILAVNLDIDVDSVDFDKWLALPDVERAVIQPPISVQEKPKDDKPSTTVSLDIPAKSKEVKKDASPAGFPTNIDATLIFKANSLTLKGGLIRQARLSADLSGGEVTISQLSAQLPGSADIALFGFVVPEEGKPKFDGEMEVSIGDLRGILGWLGVPPPPVPSDRLRKMTLVGKVSATADMITASDLDMQFDSSRMVGVTSLRLGKRPLIDADLTLDRINLDAYLGSGGNSATPPAPKSASVAADQAATEASSDANKKDIPNEFAALAALKDFDANLKTQIKTLVYGGAQIKNVVLDGSLLKSALNIRRLSVDKLAGSTFKASGTINNLGGIPEMKNIRLDAKANDISRLFLLAGAEAPVDSKKLGAVTFAGRIDGSALNPRIDLNLKGAGASIAAAGKVSFLPLIGGFTGKMKVVHGDLVRMMRSLGVSYRPGGKLGGLDLQSDVKADMKGLVLENLKGQVGPVKMNGTAEVSLTGPRTKLIADLNTGRIVADRFLPVSRNAFLTGPANVTPAAFNIPRMPTGSPAFVRLAAVAPGRWPTDPIDLSALKSFDADIKLKSTALVYGNYTLDNADVAATVDNGVLKVEKLTGGLFGGSLNAGATVKASSPSIVEAVATLENINVSKGLNAVIGESPAAGIAGMKINLVSSGYTVADLIAALGGKGSIALNRLDVEKSGKGTALSAALGLVAGLNSLGGALTGKKAGAGLADITGSFDIVKGVARSNDLKLTSSMGNGRAQGNVNLSRWLIDVAGQIEMSQNVLGLILNQGQAAVSQIPFSIKGNLDSPNVKLDTSKMQGAGLPIPGLDKILKKKGIGSILQQLVPGLGGATPSLPPSSTPPPSTSSGSSSGNLPPPPPPPPTQSQPPMKPQDLLKGLFKSLGN
jgi:uncharacterized protein involved in outer membrane biogenesis